MDPNLLTQLHTMHVYTENILKKPTTNASKRMLINVNLEHPAIHIVHIPFTNINSGLKNDFSTLLPHFGHLLLKVRCEMSFNAKSDCPTLKEH